MTRPIDLVTFQIYDSSVNGWTDYTDGLLNVVVERGQQEYSGPFTFPDTGTLTLTSRNPNLDPYTNPLVRYNSQIALRSVSTRVFTGYIEGINVEYQPAGEPPIITIKAIDIIGLLAKHVLSEDFITSQASWTTLELLQNLSTEIPQFSVSTIDTDGTEYANAPIELGTTALEALQSRVKTDLGMLVPDRNGQISYYRYDNDDPLNPYNSIPYIIHFAYDGSQSSYINVNLSDGFTRFVNDLELNGTDNTQVILNNQDSINTWGKSSATINLMTNDINILQEIGDKALDELAQPQRELTQITFNGLKAYWGGNPIAYPENVARFLSPYRNSLLIEHKIDNNNIINRNYQIVGLRHEINFNDWTTTAIIRNPLYQTIGTTNPIITRTPATGTQLTEYTYSFYYPNMNEITSIDWDVDDGFTGTDPTITVTYPTGGTKTVTLTLGTVYGYDKTVTILYYVGNQLPTSSFTYTVDADNNYDFTFTGTGATSVLWNFGDGSQSTEFNPTKFYLNSATVTVTCTATNYVGSATSSQTFSASRVAVIPVKFMKLTFYPGSSWNNDTSFVNFAQSNTQFNSIFAMELRKLNPGPPVEVGDLIGADWSMVNYEEFGGCAITAGVLDEYRRIQRVRKVDAVNSLKLGFGAFYPYREAVPSTKKAIRMTIELDKYYQDLEYIRFTGTASKDMGLCVVDVSYDGSTWYKYGTGGLSFSGLSQGTWTYDNASKTRADWTSTVATYPTETSVRYLKVSMQFTSTTGTPDYRINELFALGPGCKVNNGTYVWSGQTYETPITGCFGIGGIDLDRNSGASYQLKISAPETIAYVITYPSGNSTSGIIANNQAIPFINYKNLRDRIQWSRSVSFVDIIIDLGQLRTDVSGLYLDWRRDNTTYTTTSALTANNVLDFAWSADGTNWTSMQQNVAMLRSPNTGAFMIKTTPVTESGVTYSPPITSSSTYVIDPLTTLTTLRWPT